MVCPPSKEVVFNRNLTHNDGLVAGWIAAQENISYEKAIERLSFFTEDIKIRLNQGQRVPFGNIGVFYTDRRFNILFECGNNNFLAETYGMESLALIPTAMPSTQLVQINVPQTAASQHTLSKDLSKRRFLQSLRYGVAAAVLAGIVIVSQTDFFHSPILNKKIQNSMTIQPDLSIFAEENGQAHCHHVISPDYDYVDYDPAADLGY